MCCRDVTTDGRTVNENVVMDGSTLNNLESLYRYVLRKSGQKYGLFQELQSITRKMKIQNHPKEDCF